MPENVYLIIGSWIIVILATERTTEIIVDSKFFFPFRNWIAKHALSEGTYHNKSKLLFVFLYNMTSCAWCLSVWASMFFCWFLPGEYFHVAASNNILVKWLALVGVTNFWHAIFRLVFRGRVITVDIKHMVEMSDDMNNSDEMSSLGIIIGDDDGEH